MPCAISARISSSRRLIPRSSLFLLVREERFPSQNTGFLHDDPSPLFRELDANPEAVSGKGRSRRSTVDLDRMFDDQEAILGSTSAR